MFAHTTRSDRIRLGFIPLTDAAPLIVAREQGIFAAHGLEVDLSREVGWATLRDKVVFGELQGAHALSGLLVSTALGIASARCEVLTACVLSRHGNAITLGRSLLAAGVSDLATLRSAVRRRDLGRRPVFGVVYQTSTHHLQLRQWLRSGGIDPDSDVRVVVVPPAQMVRNLAAGTIDGCCVGEPWNTLACAQEAGRVVAWSAERHPDHVEKVLMTRSDFATGRPDEHRALVQAVIEACAWCDTPANRPALAALLSAPRYLNLPAEIIAAALTGERPAGLDAARLPLPSRAASIVFHRCGANEPRPEQAANLLEELAKAGLAPTLGDATAHQLSQTLFRRDLFQPAIESNTTHELAHR